ncbi:Uncharacterised protein [Mycobacteroides abscessus]|nr:Uncharacterised protein [Mycobacteroides abscessus]
MVEKRCTDEESVLMAVDGEVTAVENQLGTFGDPDVDVVTHALEGIGADQWSEVGAGIQRWPDHELAGTLGQSVDEALRGGLTHRDRDRDRHAALAGRAVSGTDQRVDGLVDIGVRHDDHVVLGAAKALGAFTIGGGGLVDVLRNGGRSDESDRGDTRIVQQCVHGGLVPVDNVEDAGR